MTVAPEIPVVEERWSREERRDVLSKITKWYDEAKRTHDLFVDKVEKRYNAYEGILEARSDAAQWTSKLHPPYINHIVETTLASLIDENLSFYLRPRPKLGATDEQIAVMREASQGFEALLSWQMEQDHFSEQQRPFMLQNAIAGLTVSKQWWKNRQTLRRRLALEVETDPDTGDRWPRLVETDVPETVFDGPTSEVVDVRDFLWHEAAVSLDRARYVFHRVWLTEEELERQVEAGQYGPSKGGESKAKIRKDVGESRDFSGELAYREQTLSDADRTKDMIELVECWWQEADGIYTATFAQRKVLLAYRRNPFWHGEYPFVVCSTQPGLFRIPGKSQVEKVQDLQEALWATQNQRRDNLNLINNAIVITSPDYDMDEFEFAPGAVNTAERPDQVTMWTPNPVPAELSIGSESLLKGDMQNLAGGFPFSSGSESQTVDQKTATGASIVTSLAQRGVSAMKVQSNRAWARVGQQWVWLDKQFIRNRQLVLVPGLDDDFERMEVVPEMLLADFDFHLDPGDDTLMQEKRRADETAFFQTAMQSAQTMALTGSPLNTKALFEDWAKAFGKPDTGRYFVSAQQVPPGMGTPPGASQQGPGGVTGEGSVDPMVSPSNPTPMSVVGPDQQLGAAGTGGQNA